MVALDPSTVWALGNLQTNNVTTPLWHSALPVARAGHRYPVVPGPEHRRQMGLPGSRGVRRDRHSGASWAISRTVSAAWGIQRTLPFDPFRLPGRQGDLKREEPDCSAS